MWNKLRVSDLQRRRGPRLPLGAAAVHSQLIGEDKRYKLRTRASAELGHGVADVGAHRFGGDVQLLGDLIGLPPECDQRDDLTLAFRYCKLAAPRSAPARTEPPSDRQSCRFQRVIPV